MKSLVIGVIALLCFALTTEAVDGFAVTAICRAGEDVSESAVPECYVGGRRYEPTGKIVRYTITNGTVSASDTIYKQTWARMPAINPEGTRIAFYRFDAKTENGVFSWGEGDMHISTMNMDGSDVRDILTFRDEDKGRFDRNNLDWTAGGWIYYAHPELQDGYEIWRVKGNDPSTNEKVTSYEKIQAGRFSISVDGTRAVIVSGLCNPFHDPIRNRKKDWCVMPHEFPPSSEPTRDGWDFACYAGCMGFVSPLGEHVSHFYPGGHEEFHVNKWALPSQCLSTDIVTSEELPSIITGNTEIGSKMNEAPCAANSDRWVCLQIGNSWKLNGTQQILVDWVDKKAINTSGHKWGPNNDGLAYISTSGDFWVSGGPAGACQNALGEWVAMDNMLPSHVTTQKRAGRAAKGHSVWSIGVRSLSHHSLNREQNAYDINGRKLSASRSKASGIVVIPPTRD